MDEFEFLQPSDKAKQDHAGRYSRKYSFPFDTVPVGMSFAVPLNAVKNINVLRATANRHGVRLNRKFRVIDHEKDGYEVFHVGPKVEEHEGWNRNASI